MSFSVGKQRNNNNYENNQKKKNINMKETNLKKIEIT